MLMKDNPSPYRESTGRLQRTGMRSIAVLLAATAILAAAPGCSLLPREEEALKPPLIKPVQQNYELYEVKRGSIARLLKGNAIFTTSERQELFFKESGGRLLTMKVKLGDTVNPGDVVAELESGDLATRIKQQRLTLEKAQIMLDQTMAANPGDGKAGRLKGIDVESAQITLDSLQEQLKRTQLVSGIGGIVTYLPELNAGDTIQAYSTIVGISNPKRLQLIYEVSNNADLMGIEVGMEVDFTIDDKAYKGQVLQIPSTAAPTSNKAQAEKNSKAVYFSIDNPPEDITLGTSASFTLTLEKKDDVLVIPRGALKAYIGREYVQVLDGTSRKEIDVEKGIVTQTEIEIRKGLKEGQQLIINN